MCRIDRVRRGAVQDFADVDAVIPGIGRGRSCAHGQDSHSVITPPGKTPAVPPAASESASAFVSSFGRSPNSTIESVRADGAINAAPPPCSTRPASSTAGRGPATTESSRVTTEPAVNIRRARSRSGGFRAAAAPWSLTQLPPG